MDDGIVRIYPDIIGRLLNVLSNIIEQLSMTGYLLFEAAVIGQIISIQSVLGPLIRLRTRDQYACLLCRGSWNAHVYVSSVALSDIEFWL